MDTFLAPGLYIVATPIGNLGDLSPRASQILLNADVVAVEDSRVTAGLFRHLGAKGKMTPYHDHNADAVRPGLVARMGRESVALVSDAGTPLLSDPGFELVRRVSQEGIPVVAVPGASAITAALSIAGLPTERFTFEGFLPARLAERRARIAELKQEPRTLVFFEAPHRIAESLEDLAAGFGESRRRQRGLRDGLRRASSSRQFSARKHVRFGRGDRPQGSAGA